MYILFNYEFTETNSCSFIYTLAILSALIVYPPGDLDHFKKCPTERSVRRYYWLILAYRRDVNIDLYVFPICGMKANFSQYMKQKTFLW